MGWSLATQTEVSEPQHTGINIPFDVLPFDREKYPTLSSIAPYYDTFFNPDQLVAFIAEWDAARNDPEHDERMQHWQVVRDLAERCRAEQLYLRFIGD